MFCFCSIYNMRNYLFSGVNSSPPLPTTKLPVTGGRSSQSVYFYSQTKHLFVSSFKLSIASPQTIHRSPRQKNSTQLYTHTQNKYKRKSFVISDAREKKIKKTNIPIIFLVFNLDLIDQREKERE